MVVMLGGLSWARVRFAALFYGTMLLPMLVGAQLDYMAFAMLFARLFLAGGGAGRGARSARGSGSLAGSPRPSTAVRRTWRGGLRGVVLLPYAAVIVLLGVVADAAPEPMVVVWLVPVSALATGFTIVLLSRPPRPGAQRRLAVAAVAFTVAGSVFIASRPHEAAPPSPTQGGFDDGHVRHQLLLGERRRVPHPTGEVRPDVRSDLLLLLRGARQRTAPRSREMRDPHRRALRDRAHPPPIAEQAAVFTEQVRDLPRPLVVMAHSHAAWVAWTAVAGGMAPQVDVLVLNGPFRESIQGYPPPDENGPGKTAGDLLRLSVRLGNLFGANHQTDSPTSRETLADPTAPTAIFARPLHLGVRAIAVHAAVDLPLQPSGWRLPIEHNACPLRVSHPSLPRSDATIEEVNRFLDRRPPPSCPSWRDWGVPMTRGFSVPTRNAPPG